MAKQKPEGPSLFDVIEAEEVKLDPSLCLHRTEVRTETIWPGENCKRLTMTCATCGRVRGRYPKE